MTDFPKTFTRAWWGRTAVLFVILYVLLKLLTPASAHGQTIGPPVASRGDSVLVGSATVTWPATYDSSRAVVTICGQVRVSGVTQRSVCRTKTGPWVRHVVVQPSLPDLVVTAVNYADGGFTSTVKNQGTATIPSTVLIGVGYSVDGVYQRSGGTFTSLAPGASVNIAPYGEAYVMPSGEHTATALVDDVNRFLESDEANNKLSITVGTAPTLSSIRLTPDTLILAIGGTQQLSVQGVGTDGSTMAVSPVYAVTGGSITPQGLYTAGTARSDSLGWFRVIAAASGKADTTAIWIGPPGAPGAPTFQVVP